MKLIKKSIAVLVLVITASLTVNCSSSSSSDSTAATFYLKCKVNGVQYNAVDPTVINSLKKSLTAQSTASESELVQLYFPLNASVGTHPIAVGPSDVNVYEGGYNNLGTGVSGSDGVGTMTISVVTADVIQGTFSFTSPDGNGGTIAVTEGTFRAENIQ